MKRQRKCRHCRDLFLPDPRSYRPSKKNRFLLISPQHYCSKPDCQQASRLWSHKRSIRKKPLYRQKQLESARRWRKKNSKYWSQYRKTHPQAVKVNRERQRQRDKKAKDDLANINTIGAILREKLNQIGVLIDLANINPTHVGWDRVFEEILAFLRWFSHLANIKAIDLIPVVKPQSRL